MSKVFQSLPSHAWNWIRRLGAVGLVVLGAADSAPVAGIPPGTVDALLIALCMSRPRWWFIYAVLATVGEVIGGYIAYRLAEKGGQELLEKNLGKSRAQKFYQRFEKRGFVSVFMGAILPPPFPFTSVLMAAGVMQYPRKRFLSALTMGRAVRFFGEAYLGRIYGRQMIDFFSQHYKAGVYLLVGVALAGIIGAIVYFKWWKPRSNSAHQTPKPAKNTSTKS